MPITKVPIVHKFGIISHSQRLELQERLLKQSYLKSLNARKQQLPTRNPLEVNEDFVQLYNNAGTLAEQDKMEQTANKMLERIKRRAGLKDGGQGVHVDLPIAWTELAQLAQCKGQIQEECLDVLITSLDQAPLEKPHIPALFYLAETTLYWLRTEAIHQPYLRTGEIKLLRMGQLVFLRLFYHHMAGQLQGHAEFKARLFTYLDGFADSQDAYSPYPNALLCIRYIIEVGKVIIGEIQIEDPTKQEVPKEIDVATTRSRSEKTETIETKTNEETVSSELFHEVSANYDETQSSHSGIISSSVHDLSPTLWHALDVWRCIRHRSAGLDDALRALGNCGLGLSAESWIDVTCAFYILADAAKVNLPALRTFENLARGVRPKPMRSTANTNLDDDGLGLMSADRAGSVDPLGIKPHNAPLSDIYEKSEEYVSTSTATRYQTSATNSRPSHEEERSHSQSPDNLIDTAESSIKGDRKAERPSRPTPKGAQTNADTIDTNEITRELDLDLNKQQAIDIQKELEKGTIGQSQTGNNVDQHTGRTEGAESSTSGISIQTYGNCVHSESPGLHGWHWEVAINYADMLADVCLHGTTSTIQKMALVGNNKEVSDLHRKSRPSYPMKSAGLLDLVYFRAAHETQDGGPNDWSWRVRYSAIQGLVKICRCSAGDPTREGLRTVSWNTLIRAHSLERDMRVLEALKVGQVDANIENLLAKHLSASPSTIGAKIALGLAQAYLPPLPPPVSTVTQKKPTTKKIVTAHPITRKPMRTALKDEIALATALYEPSIPFTTKTDFDLRRIVEDQWRKEQQTQLEEEAAKRHKEMQATQRAAEQAQKDTEELRKQKLKHKYNGPAYQTVPVSKLPETLISPVHSPSASPSAS